MRVVFPQLRLLIPIPLKSGNELFTSRTFNKLKLTLGNKVIGW
jgi:hypothetical protein